MLDKPVDSVSLRSMCVPGEFLLDNLCFECPPSFYCPGNDIILPCPQGRYCSQFGMDAPTGICPPGHICDIHTVRPVPNEFIQNGVYNTMDYLHIVWNETLILRGLSANASSFSYFVECVSLSLRSDWEPLELLWTLSSDSNYSEILLSGNGDDHVDCFTPSNDECYNLTVWDIGKDGEGGGYIFIFWELVSVGSIYLDYLTTNTSFHFCRPGQFSQGMSSSFASFFSPLFLVFSFCRN